MNEDRLELRAIWDAVLDSHGYSSITEVPAERLEAVWDEIQSEVDQHPSAESLNGLLTTLSGTLSSLPSSNSPSKDPVSSFRGMTNGIDSWL